MARVSKVLRSTEFGYLYWCPGCDHSHHVWTKQARPNGAVWSFNGNVDKPTFHPSVRHFIPEHTDEGVTTPERTTCHYFIVDGQIRYCGDCDHKLSGQTVDLPEMPPASAYKYGDEDV